MNKILMSLSFIGVVYFFLRRNQNHNNSSRNENGSFFTILEEESAKANFMIKKQIEEYSNKQKANFSNDLAIKKSLTELAKKHNLDQALICVFTKMRFYNLEENMFNIHNLEKNNDNFNSKTHTKISFDWKGGQFVIDYVERDSYLPDGEERHAEFSIIEYDEVVFKISSFMNYEDYTGDAVYNSPSIDSFKQKGKWFKFLLMAWKEVKVRDGKRKVDWNYYGADKIKNDFVGGSWN